MSKRVIIASAPRPDARARLERIITRAWQAVLGVDEPGMTDNFFDLGGHSALLVRVSGLLAEETGREITPLTILEHPTIAALARHLEPTAAEEAAGTDEPASIAGRDRLRQRRARAASEQPRESGTRQE
jgi:hypothetical protein